MTPLAASVPRRLLFRDLDHPRRIVGHLTPNWFASIMGTGIVANAAAILPLGGEALRPVALVVWLLAATLLVALLVATAAHWASAPIVARTHHRHPVMVHFYGAPPMALLTVGAGTLLVGRDLVGLDAAVAIDAVLWSVGTVLGLVTAVAVPVLTFLRDDVEPDAPFGGWLMPIVPPMVSAATGALLVPFLPAGEPRAALLLASYAMFGATLLASVFVVAMVWSRLAHRTIGALGAVPTLWIVLGPLGQSVTAAALLGRVAPDALDGTAIDPGVGRALAAFPVVFGVPVLGFALLWTAIAATITVVALRRRMPFSLTWWSFTFPVGTCVTGTAALAVTTGSTPLAVAALVAFAGLVVAWTVVAARTAWGSVVRGSLFLP